MAGFTYVMSDLHGEYEMYLRMLSAINFSDDDMLIILGDCCDRGPRGIDILKDLMKRENVICIKGNHDLMLLENLPLLMEEIPDNVYELFSNRLTRDQYDGLDLWLYNGGKSTIRELAKVTPSERAEIGKFVDSFNDYLELTVDDKEYILIHAGLYGYDPRKHISEYSTEDLVWHRLDYTKTYFKNKFLITGHTMTSRIPRNPNPGKIFKGYGNIAIDCGACAPNGRLACLRLEDWEEFYIEHVD